MQPVRKYLLIDKCVEMGYSFIRVESGEWRVESENETNSQTDSVVAVNIADAYFNLLQGQ